MRIWTPITVLETEGKCAQWADYEILSVPAAQIPTKAVELRQTAWLNRKNELWVHAPAPLGSRLVSTWPNFGASLG